MAVAAPASPALTPANRWLAALACFGVLYLPLYFDAFNGLWNKEEHAHGPMIVAISLWLVWQARAKLLALPIHHEASATGWVAIAFGVTCFLLGRAVNFSILEFASQIFVAGGIVLVVGGWRAVRLLWFPLFFLIFMIPLPGVLVDAATGALKQWVSVIAEGLLSLAGYPVGRTGVMLVVGHYQLLVADACSGLHSMFTLSAMGMLLMYIRARQSLVHNALMLAAILPIAFTANIIRVMVLVLVTYHLGDEAGQGFLHGAAGVVLMVGALLIFIAFDAFLAFIARCFGR